MKNSKSLIKKETELIETNQDNNPEWVNALCDEIQAIAVTKTFNSRVEIIEGKWLIGKEIEEAIKDKSREAMYGKKINKLLAEQLHWSEREIYRCRQFFLKYKFDNFDKALSKLPDTKLTWHNITNSYLLENSDNPKKKQHEYISIRIDEDNKTLYIKSDYKRFKIKYYD